MTSLASIPSILRDALRDFARSFVALIGYEVMVRVAGAVLLAPAGAWLLRALIGTTGRYAVGNTELIAFAFSPIGLAVVVAAGVFGLFGLSLQHAGPILIAEARSRGRRLSALDAFRRVALKAPAMIHLGLLQIARYARIAVPVLAVVGLAYWGLWSDADLYFLTQARPPVFWVGAILAGVAVATGAILSARLFLRWLIALPLLLIEGRRPAEALRLSAERTSGATARNLVLLLACTLGGALASSIAAGLFLATSDALLDRLPGTLAATIPGLAGLLALNFLLFEAVEVAGSIVVGLVVYRIAREHGLDATVGRGLAEPGPVAVRLRSHRRRIARGALVVVLAAVVAASLFALGLLATIGVAPSVTITAHRGGSKAAPENTIAAIRNAIAAGADAAEIDVQLTADNVVVVFHDEDLMRLAGDRRRLAELTFEEARAFDVGAWFAPEFRGERIPTLDEVLREAGDRLRLNIELKVTRSQPDPAPLVRGVLEALDRNGARDRCVISTLSAPALAEVRRQAPDLPVGFIVFEAVGDPTRLDLDFLSVRDALATDDFIARASRRGLPVHVWTINDPEQFSTFVGRGVADVLTSDPALLVAARSELAGLNDLERLLLWYRRILNGG